jgi:protein kinase-like protein/Calx-beta domain-containing protein
LGTSTTTSRFVIEADLDHVPFGSLHRAIDTARSQDGRSGERVALWKLPLHVGSAPLDVLLHEFARVRGLAHPSIARAFELDRDGDGYFLVSEFLDGETLRNVLDHLKPECLEPHEADEVLRTIGDALAYAHDRDVVHGEVRAENVLVTMDHRCVLTNFMANRLLRWRPSTAAPADDVRDFAALAYELHTGERLPAHSRTLARNTAPKRLLRAIETVLQSKRHELSLREFLAAAGLDDEAEEPAPAPRTEAPQAAPRYRGAPAEMVELGPRRERANAAAPRSFWRIALPFMGVAAIAFALHATGGLAALLGVGQRLQDWSLAMLEPVPDAKTADSAADGVSQLSGPATGVAGQTDAGSPAPPEGRDGVEVVPAADPAQAPAIAAEQATVSFGTPRVSARESQGVVSVEIVRKGGGTSPVDVAWWTSEGTAHAREDFASFGKRVERLDTPDARRRIYIPIVSDSIPEGTKYFEIHLAPQRDDVRLGAIETVQVALSDDDY